MIRRITRFIILFTICHLGIYAAFEAAEPEKKDTSKLLFDGKTLDGWKPSDFDMAGKVHVKDGTIVMEKGKQMTGVTYAKKDFPKMDYELTFEGKKLAGNDFFCTATFPVGDSFCSFVTGGWGGGVIGISSINGADASENETGKSHEFKQDQWYKIRIRVTQKKVETWIDGEQVVDLETADRKLSTRIECRVCQPLGFATYATVGAVRNVRVRPLTDAEKKAAPKKEE
jgi:hypothetical protein